MINSKVQQFIVAWTELSSMSSTRKQRTIERRSRQAGVMSDVETLDVMLGSHSRTENESNSKDRYEEVDHESNRPRPETIQNGDDFRSLLNTQ